MRKIIFLDFDGVLNTEKYQAELQYKGYPKQDEFGSIFDPNAVARLKYVIETTCADIVVQSSWKYLGLDAMQEMWTARNLPGKIVDITPSKISDEYLLKTDISSFDVLKFPFKGLEIDSWLIAHNKQTINYVIIDDEDVILDSQFPYFVQTNPHDGLTKTVADIAISILNK